MNARNNSPKADLVASPRGWPSTSLPVSSTIAQPCAFARSKDNSWRSFDQSKIPGRFKNNGYLVHAGDQITADGDHFGMKFIPVE